MKLFSFIEIPVDKFDVFVSPWCCDSNYEDRYFALMDTLHKVREAAKQLLFLVDSPLRPLAPPPLAQWKKELLFFVLKQPQTGFAIFWPYFQANISRNLLKTEFSHQQLQMKKIKKIEKKKKVFFSLVDNSLLLFFFFNCWD